MAKPRESRLELKRFFPHGVKRPSFPLGSSLTRATGHWRLAAGNCRGRSAAPTSDVVNTSGSLKRACLRHERQHASAKLTLFEVQSLHCFTVSVKDILKTKQIERGLQPENKRTENSFEDPFEACAWQAGSSAILPSH